nr:MAG TPA: hypothetical protein [Caudoviricetes sp.]
MQRLRLLFLRVGIWLIYSFLGYSRRDRDTFL